MSEETPRTFGQSLFHLIGHVVGSGVLFVTLAVVAWVVDWVVSAMNAIHPFDPSVLALLHALELGFFRLDAILTVFVLVVGALRFLRDLVRVLK